MKTLFVLMSLLVFSAQAHFRIIGENDLIVVKSDFSNVPAQFKKILPAIGELSTGCTVSHIGQGFVITAGHCFFHETFLETNLKLNRPCAGEVVKWPNSTIPSKCLEILAIQRDSIKGQDFAIFKVAQPPRAVVTVDWKFPARALQNLTIFSYPVDQPFSWSQLCPLKKLTQQDVMLNYMHYVCDTEKGSSGAAILDATTGNVVGLHITGDGLDQAVQNLGIHITRTPIRVLLKKFNYKESL